MHNSKSCKKQWRQSDRVDDQYGGGVRGFVGDGVELDDCTYDPDAAEEL